jgi:hypothetical protein
MITVLEAKRLPGPPGSSNVLAAPASQQLIVQGDDIVERQSIRTSRIRPT